MVSSAVAGEVEAAPGGARREELPRPALALLALLVTGLFAWNVSRTWFQSDDAFISFRYARNLADGLGLCWNAGERVEGYTNFAWVLLMAGGMELGLQPEVLANVLGVTSGSLVLFGLLRFAARGRALVSPWPWLLVLVLAASRSFAAWCTGGLETMFFALLVFAGFARLRRPWGKRDPLLCGLCFAGAALVRPEGVLFGALAFALLAGDLAFDAIQRRALDRGRVRAGLTWLAPCVLIVGAHLLWRRAYYGEWLPNTFYAKVSGAWVEQGLRYLAYYHDTYRIGWFLPLAFLGLAGPNRSMVAAWLFVLLGYVSYLLYVGGDLFELRFCVHVFPLLYWLLIEGLATLASAGWSRARLAPPILATAAALALLVTTHLGFERVPGNLYGLQTVPGIEHYTRARQEQGRFLRERIERGVLPRDLVLGLGGAGAVPYYTGWTTVDRRGLNDATIARMSVPERGLVGHERDAPHAYLVERRVAVFDYFNQLLVKPQGVRQLRGPYFHDGQRLEMRAIPLGERVLVFATFVDDAELARLFPGVQVLVLGG